MPPHRCDSDDDEASEAGCGLFLQLLSYHRKCRSRWFNPRRCDSVPPMIHELDCGSQTYAEGELVPCESDRAGSAGRSVEAAAARPG